MSRRIYPHSRVRYWYTYDIDDICTLYSEFSLHPQTVRKWVTQGLKTIDKGKPMLIYGNDLIQYLKRNNDANKRPTAFDELYCGSCHDAQPILQSRIAIEQAGHSLKVRGKCRQCKGKMVQNYKLSDFSELRRRFKIVDVSELYDDATPADKTHIHAPTKEAQNESLQGELFG